MCLNPLFLRILYLSKITINILRFLVPLFLIFKLILGIYQKIINPKESEGIKIIRDRVIAALIVFLVPTVVSLLITFISKVSDNNINKGLDQCMEFANLTYIENLEKNISNEEYYSYLDESYENLSKYEKKVAAVRLMIQENNNNNNTPSIGNYTDDKNNIACNTGSKYDDGLFKMVKSAGPKTREGVVAAALYLSSHIDVKIPYFWGGTSSVGVNNDWGCQRKIHGDGTSAQPKGTKHPYGLDCCGFVGWSILNGGYYVGGNQNNVVPYTRNKNGYFTSLGDITNLPRVSISKAKGKIKPGDIATKFRHVGVVVEVSDSGFKVAEEKGAKYGLVINEYKYKESDDGFKYIVQMDKFYNNYKKGVSLYEKFK